MKNWFKIWWISFVLFLPQGVFAAEGAGFNVTPLINTYQNGEMKGYWSLVMASGDQTQLKLNITNISEEQQTFTINLNSATTNEHGILDYGKTTQESRLTVPKSLIFSNFTKLAANKISVPAKSSQQITVKLQLPKRAFQGELVGGVTVTRDVRHDEQNRQGLTNQFAYAIPIVIRESSKVIVPNLKAELPQLKTDNALHILMKNVNATLLKQVTLVSKLTDSTGTVVWSYTDTSRSIAPQNQFIYRVPLGDAVLATGKYIYSLTVFDASDHKWHWQNEINVPKVKRTQELSKTGTKSNQINRMIVLISALMTMIIILLVIVFLLLLRQRKDAKKVGRESYEKTNIDNSSN